MLNIFAEALMLATRLDRVSHDEARAKSRRRALSEFHDEEGHHLAAQLRNPVR
jgi:hypothetical protein